MKNYILVSTIVLLAALTGCKSPKASISSSDNGEYTLSSDKLSMTIDAVNGARIVSFKYNDSEILSQTRLPSYFGSTFWVSPQSYWGWPPIPEHDEMEYSVEELPDEGRIIMTSQLSDKIPLRIIKDFSTDSKDGSFVITYSLKNEADSVWKAAPWEITRVPPEGLIFFDTPENVTLPDDSIPFKPEFGVTWYTIDQADHNRIINFDGKGWLGYVNNGLLFIKKFQDIDSTQPAPRANEIQIYVNKGKTYVEIENQGAYTVLQPGESLSWTVKWYLQPYDGGSVASDELVGKSLEITQTTL